MTRPVYANAAVQTSVRAALSILFALAAALAVCVVMLVWTPLEAPVPWRAIDQNAAVIGTADGS